MNSASDILSTLIGIPTVSRDSNLTLVEWVQNYLDGYGIASQLIYDADRRKANLWTTIGPPGDGGIVLSGHTDVVSTDGQAWSSDPFQAVVRDGRIFGRGACDMKGFIACVLSQVPTWIRLPLLRPLHLAFSYDEELGCIGVQTLIAHLKAIGLKAAGCIVGEPTSMEPVIAHKGRICIHGRVQGRAAHSSLVPEGVNAIDYAARLIGFARELAEREAVGGLRQEGFDVPFSTLATTTIRGGVATNTIPEHCDFSLDYRYLPGVDPERVLSALHQFGRQLVVEMRSRAPEADIELRQDSSVLPFDRGASSKLTSLTQSLLRTDKCRKVAYGTEAGYFEGIDIPAIVCGPGAIAQAHRADEYVTIEQLQACSSFLEKLGELSCR